MITQETIDQLELIVAEARESLPALACDHLIDRAIGLLPTLEQAVDLHLPVRCIYPLGVEIESKYGMVGRSAFARAFVAALAIRQAKKLHDSGFPLSVLALYPIAYTRLAQYLRTKADATYWVGQDAFLKDIRLAGGFSVPCGAQDVDLISTISKGSGLKAIVKWREFSNGWTVLRDGGPPWFSIHTDQRYTEDFNEAGWDRCYRRIAEMLVQQPSIKGMVGTSWFYDPQIVTVSPRLAYLQFNPVQRGAFLLPHGPGKIHTERATQKSETRKQLYDEGKYLPVCYSLIWHRSSLIGWATAESA